MYESNFSVSVKEPPFPEIAVPVVNVNAPLIPFASDFGVLNRNAPLDIAFD